MLVISGSLGLIVLFLGLPALFAPSLSPDEAEKWIRHYLKKEQASLLLNRMKAEERHLPDRTEAGQLEADFDKIENLRFRSIELKHFLLAPPTTSTRIFMARVVLDDGTNTIIRYFSLSARNNMFDFFWVNEQPQWMWYFSI